MKIDDITRAILSPQPQTVGPLTTGRYIQVGMGLGFYVPESDYQMAQLAANQSGCIQFLGVDSAGRAITGPRDFVLEHSAAGCAWIVPQN